MAGLSNIAAALAGAATGAGNEYADLAKQQDANKKYEAMQEAIMNRQSALEDQKSLPKSLYGPLWSKMTGLPLPEGSPESLNPSLGGVLFNNPWRMGRNDSYDNRTVEMGNRPVGGRGGRGTSVDPKVLANIEAESMKAGRAALGGRVPPDLTTLVEPQRGAFNTAFRSHMAGLLGSYGIHQYNPYDPLAPVPAVPASGLHGMMGMGQAAVPERSSLVAAPWATPGAGAGAAPVQQQQAPQGGTPIQDPNHLAVLHQARQQGMDDATIAAKFASKGITYNPADIAATP